MIFLNLRTDIALESREIEKNGDCEGVILKKYTEKGVEVTEIEICDERGADALGKPVGKYITFEVTSFLIGSSLFSSPELSVLSTHISALLPESDAPVLIAGLGNDEITADSLGPKTAAMIFATRHIGDAYAEKIGIGRLRSVACISASVLGKTGIESGEMIECVVEKIKPCAVITVDALAARRLERLGTTVQISTGGVVPGSGVGNSRKKINKETLGVPVISIGVPMVVDGETFIKDVLGEGGNFDISLVEKNITVTPKDIDIMTQRASRLIACAINSALQPTLSPEEIFAVVTE